MICFGSLERDYSLSTGDMTLKKGLRAQHSKDVQLHNSLGSARPVNELRTTCTHNLRHRLPLVRRILNEATNEYTDDKYSLDCSQPLCNLRTRKKERSKRVRSTRGWGVGFASEASEKNREAVDIFGIKWTY